MLEFKWTSTIKLSFVMADSLHKIFIPRVRNVEVAGSAMRSWTSIVLSWRAYKSMQIKTA